MTPQEKNTVRIVCISDTHCRYDFELPEGDILVHAGDFTKSGLQSEIEDFLAWLKSLTQFRLKLFIAGNHEPGLDTIYSESRWERWHCDEIKDHQIIKQMIRDSSLATTYGIIYLEDEQFIDDVTGLKFYGSPCEPSMHRGAFTLPLNSAELKEAWSRIPNDVDILLTHYPPKNILDTNMQGENVGCALLLERLNEIKPRLHVFGHIHEAHGRKHNDSTIFVNAAICGRGHQSLQSSTVINLNTSKRRYNFYT